MTEDEILDLSMEVGIVEGWRVGVSGVQWKPVDEEYFRTYLTLYTEKVVQAAKEQILKDVTITSKTNGEVVAVTLTDEDTKIYKVIWVKGKIE